MSPCHYLLRDPVSCRRPPSPFLNGQELPLLPARPPERQHSLQGRAQGPHRHPAGRLRDGPLRDRGKRGGRSLPRGPKGPQTEVLTLCLLSSGLWPERVPALPGGPDRAGQRVSLEARTCGGLVGEQGSAGLSPSDVTFVRQYRAVAP